MAIQVETRDCAALNDADLDEMASMGGAFDIGALSKAKESWVLSTTARIEDRLHGFAFATLERIGLEGWRALDVDAPKKEKTSDNSPA